MSEEEKDQTGDGSPEVKRHCTSPKVSKETWRRIKSRFEEGSYTSLKELSEEFGISHESLRQKVFKEKWNARRLTIENKLSQEIEKKIIKEADLVQTYLSNTFKRALRLEKIADASLSQASLTNDGIPLVDLDQVDILTRSELRIHELAKSALRIIPVSQVEHTGGKDFGSSFVEAIERLRNDKNSPKLGPSDLQRVLEADIVD